jgi:hypothetical protein
VTSRSGLPFWHEQLQQGHRLTAIGGSDTHNVTAAVELIPTGRLGIPTTVVRSDALGVRAILDAIRAGAVFIDIAGTRDRQLEQEAACAAASCRHPFCRSIRRMLRVIPAAC